MSGAPLPKEELARLFEAARWAPSSGNSQPWRFVVAQREQPSFSSFFSLLTERNQSWCHNAAALIIVCGKTHRTASDGTERPSRLYAFDCGAAWMSLALQGTLMGLVVHAMEGFDHKKAKEVIHAPEHIDVLCMVAVGLPGDPAQLPENLQAGETPNQREPQTKLVFDSSF